MTNEKFNSTQIPDVLTEYYLTKSGFSQPETRLFALNTQEYSPMLLASVQGRVSLMCGQFIVLPVRTFHGTLRIRIATAAVRPTASTSIWPVLKGVPNERPIRQMYGAVSWLLSEMCMGLDYRTRLISLAAQKFVSDIAEEANWYTAQRQQIGIKAKQEQGFDVR
eukprot:3948624-Pyramimonas_sp.AAC.2